MKYFIVICSLLIFNINVYAQPLNTDAFFEGNYDVDYLRSKKIKNITIDIFINGKKTLIHSLAFDKQGLLTTYQTSDDTAKKLNTHLFIYNDKGHRIEYTRVDHESKEQQKVNFTNIYKGSLLISQQSEELFSITKFAYNSKGQKTNVKKLVGPDTTLASKIISDYGYDPRGKLQSVVTTFIDNYGHINSKSKEIFIYDNKGKLQYVKREEDPTYLITFDKKGLLKSQKQTMPEELGGFEILDEYRYSFWK